MGTAMIGCQEHQIVALPHLFVERFQQSCYVLIQRQIGCIGIISSRTILMTNDVSLRVADAQHVRGLSPTQLLAVQGCNGHIGSHCTTDGRQSDVATQFLRLLVLLQLLVVLLGPLWQLSHIIGTGDKLHILRVEPVGTIGRMACRQYGRPVLVAHADDLRAEVGM